VPCRTLCSHIEPSVSIASQLLSAKQTLTLIQDAFKTSTHAAMVPTLLADDTHELAPHDKRKVSLFTLFHATLFHVTPFHATLFHVTLLIHELAPHDKRKVILSLRVSILFILFFPFTMFAFSLLSAHSLRSPFPLT
jgi:hypothetical protein